MSIQYIQKRFTDIKGYASVIENRLDDSDCTMESVLSDNIQTLEMCKKYSVNYILIDNEYDVDIEL